MINQGSGRGRRYSQKVMCREGETTEVWQEHLERPTAARTAREDLCEDATLELRWGKSHVPGKEPRQRPRDGSALVAQSCLTLCDPMACSPRGSSVHGILQSRIMEWVVISFSRGSSPPRDGICSSCIGRQILYC